ncbi:MAG: hypothetical protein V1647_06310 [Pseudomonadota bacterium]
MSNMLIIATALITLLVGLSRDSLFYRLAAMYTSFCLIAILIFKSNDELFLILVAGFVVNMLLVLGHKGYGVK